MALAIIYFVFILSATKETVPNFHFPSQTSDKSGADTGFYRRMAKTPFFWDQVSWL